MPCRAADSFDFKAIPKLNSETANAIRPRERLNAGSGTCPLRMAYRQIAFRNRLSVIIERRENVIALGPSGTGKTHVALGLGLAACQKGMSVSFTTAAALVNELMEARDERRLLRLQKQLASVKLLIIPLGSMLRMRLPGNG